MSSIPSKLIITRTSVPSRIRHTKHHYYLNINGIQRPQHLKTTLSNSRQLKSIKSINLINSEVIRPRNFALIAKVLQRPLKLLSKLSINSQHNFKRRTQPFAFKHMMKSLKLLKTLTVVFSQIYGIKYCASLKNLKISIPEYQNATSSSQLIAQVSCLSKLQRVEISIANVNQALGALRKIHQRIKSKHCWVDITLLKAFYPCMDNIEAISQPDFKKVASMELNLAKLAATPTSLDQDKFEVYYKFLKFLLEPTDKESKMQHKRSVFELVKFPGMKLAMDPKETNVPRVTVPLLKQIEDLKFELTGPLISSFFENCLNVYASSVFYCLQKLDVLEYIPDQNLAKLYFELTSCASAWEVLELLKDIIEFKDIRYLYLDLEVKKMTKTEFKAIIDEISKIERLQFLYVASGDFALEIEHPCGKVSDGLVTEKILKTIDLAV